MWPIPPHPQSGGPTASGIQLGGMDFPARRFHGRDALKACAPRLCQAGCNLGGEIWTLIKRCLASKDKDKRRQRSPCRTRNSFRDSYQYRAIVPTLAQYDRDKSSRKERRIGDSRDTQLITLGTKRKAIRPIGGESKSRRTNPNAHGSVMGAMLAAASPRRSRRRTKCPSRK